MYSVHVHTLIVHCHVVAKFIVLVCTSSCMGARVGLWLGVPQNQRSGSLLPWLFQAPFVIIIDDFCASQVQRSSIIVCVGGEPGRRLEKRYIFPTAFM